MDYLEEIKSLRKRNKKEDFEKNNIGRRLKFAREKLGLRQVDVYRALDIPQSNYDLLESGARTLYYEELNAIASFLNIKWEDKYRKHYPTYEKREVREISIVWLMFGHDKRKEWYEKEIEEIRQDFRRRERQLMERQFDIENKEKE